MVVSFSNVPRIGHTGKVNHDGFFFLPRSGFVQRIAQPDRLQAACSKQLRYCRIEQAACNLQVIPTLKL